MHVSHRKAQAEEKEQKVKTEILTFSVTGETLTRIVRNISEGGDRIAAIKILAETFPEMTELQMLSIISGEFGLYGSSNDPQGMRLVREQGCIEEVEKMLGVEAVGGGNGD